jgi:hypothetical protein
MEEEHLYERVVLAANRDARKVEHVIRTEHTGLGFDSGFGAGLPRIVFVDQLHP